VDYDTAVLTMETRQLANTVILETPDIIPSDQCPLPTASRAIATHATNLTRSTTEKLLPSYALYIPSLPTYHEAFAVRLSSTGSPLWCTRTQTSFHGTACRATNRLPKGNSIKSQECPTQRRLLIRLWPPRCVPCLSKLPIVVGRGRK
jgi:hypothetical protein